MTTCPSCSAESAIDKRFCAECGARLQPYTTEEVQQLVQQVLDRRFGEREVVQREISASVTKSLIDSAKIVAAIVGLPIAIMFVVLGWFGIKSTGDIIKQVDERMTALKKDADELAPKMQEIKTFVANSKQIQADVDALQGATAALRRDIDEIDPCTVNVHALAECPESGCANADSPQGALNAMKRRIPAGVPIRLTMSDLIQLQAAADQIVGQGVSLDRADREQIRALRVGRQLLGEGMAVAVGGFISGKPHPNTGESVNCRLSGLSNNDIVVHLVESSGQEEFEAIVAELIPQNRNPRWTPKVLGKVAAANLPVLIEGQLLYDNVHRVNRNPNAPIGGQPKRLSLWEVHPVTRVYVCTKTACGAKSTDGWTRLEDLPD